jgi:hypothetical protein
MRSLNMPKAGATCRRARSPPPLGLLKKALPDLSSESTSDLIDRDADGRPALEIDLIEFRIVDPHR